MPESPTPEAEPLRAAFRDPNHLIKACKNASKTRFFDLSGCRFYRPGGLRGFGLFLRRWAMSKNIDQGLKRLRGNKRAGSIQAAQTVLRIRAAPTGLQVNFRVLPRIASAPSARTSSWAIILRSPRELLPLRGLVSPVLTQTPKRWFIVRCFRPGAPDHQGPPVPQSCP